MSGLIRNGVKRLTASAAFGIASGLLVYGVHNIKDGDESQELMDIYPSISHEDAVKLEDDICLIKGATVGVFVFGLSLTGSLKL